MTLRPARLITTSAPSSSAAQGPWLLPSQGTVRQGVCAGGGRAAEDGDVVALGVEGAGEDRADLSGAAGEKDFHLRPRLSYVGSYEDVRGRMLGRPAFGGFGASDRYRTRREVPLENPFTGETMTFKAKPASKKVRIAALKNLKEMVN